MPPFHLFLHSILKTIFLKINSKKSDNIYSVIQEMSTQLWDAGSKESVLRIQQIWCSSVENGFCHSGHWWKKKKREGKLFMFTSYFLFHWCAIFRGGEYALEKNLELNHLSKSWDLKTRNDVKPCCKNKPSLQKAKILIHFVALFECFLPNQSDIFSSSTNKWINK